MGRIRMRKIRRWELMMMMMITSNRMRRRKRMTSQTNKS